MDITQNGIFILAVLFLNIVLSEWLVKRTFLRHLGVALLVILLTAVVANVGIIPTSSNTVPLYDGIFNIVAPVAIFLLLLEVNLKNLKLAGPPMIIMFLVGSVGTAVGVIAADYLIDAKNTIGPLHHAVGGMFTGTYTGGSINFNALAMYYQVNREGMLYATSVAIDNIATTIWMIATIAIPKFLQKKMPRIKTGVNPDSAGSDKQNQQRFIIIDITLLLALALVAKFVSDQAANWLLQHGVQIPSILILTTISLVIAQIPVISRLKSSRSLGLLGVYLFLAVIGAYCDIASLMQNGQLALVLFLFVVIIIGIHAILIYGMGALLKYDWDIIAVASQANIGGSTSALALSESLGRHDLLLSAILVGSLGNGIGTYLGFIIAGLL